MTKPAYRRHRTEYQEQFDIKLLYTFIGCLIGIICVIVLLLIYPPKEKTSINAEVSQTKENVILTEEKQTSDPETILQTTEKNISVIPLVLNKNETLSGLLKRGQTSMQDALDASKALNLVYDVRKLRPQQTFELFFENTKEDKDHFIGFKMETRNGDIISVLKNKNGEFIPQTKEGIIQSEFIGLEGIIETNFSNAAQKAGIPPTITNQVIHALDGAIDFNKDLKKGQTFKILYEQKTTDKGIVVGKSQLVFVSFSTEQTTHQRYFFIDGLGIPGFYDAQGQSSPQVLLQRPLGKGRISSNFGMRLHPILGYQIQHKGIDFPAKTGTPIPAAADGTIERIGRNGGYGKYIKIKHNNTYSTAYGHLDSFNPELKKGSFVKKGEIIGYVGNTGRSTGSHLHYEVLQKGKPVNPLKKHTIPQRTLKNQTLQNFQKRKAQIDALLVN